MSTSDPPASGRAVAKASQRPSGDQASGPIEPRWRSIVRTAPPRTRYSDIETAPALRVAKAICVPSGDQAGEATSPRSNSRLPDPSASTALSPPSPTYAIHFPSGDHEGDAATWTTERPCRLEPSSPTIQSSDVSWPLSTRTYAIRRPSGDHVGEAYVRYSAKRGTTRRRFAPFALETHTPSSVNATRPVREYAG